MSYFRIPKGSNLILNVLLADGNNSKYPQAHVYFSDTDGLTPIVGSPFNLTSVGNGLYSNHSVTVPEGRYVTVSVVYNDAGHTAVSNTYGRSMDVYDVTDIMDVNAISEGVWRETLSGNVLAGTFGKALSDVLAITGDVTSAKANTDTLVSRITLLRASNLDKLDLNVSSVPGATWDVTRTGHATTGTFGETLDAKISTREAESAAASRFTSVSDQLTMMDSTISATDYNVSDIKIQTAQMVFDSGMIVAKAEAVTDKTGYGLASSSEDAIVDKVWNEALSGHTTAGTAGKAVSDAATGTDPLLVADKVWDEVRSGHVASGSFGEALQGALSVARASKIDNLDAAVSTLQTEANALSRHNASIAQHTTTQGTVASVSGKLGTPAGASVSADIAAIKSETSKIGSPVSGTIASNVAGVKSAVDSANAGIAALDATIGDPAGADLVADVAAVKTLVQGVKAKTDNLSFNGANVLARTTINEDKTSYSLSSAEHNSLIDDVWDANLAGYTASGSAGEALGIASEGVDPASVADAVWNEATSGHTASGSFGNLVSTIQVTDTGIANELVNGTYGLDKLRIAIANAAASVISEVNANETKIDAITPAITSAKNAVIAEVNANEAKIDAVIPAITSAKNAMIAEVDANEAKIVALDGKVSTLSNNTTVRFIVPERIILPTYGIKEYSFYLRLFDENGVPEAADSLPVVTVKDLSDNSIISTVTMSLEAGKTGCYVCGLQVSSSTDKAPILVEAVVVKDGVTRYIPAVSEITEFESDLTAVQSKLLTVESKVDAANGHLTNATYGLSSLKSGQTTIVSEVNANEALINAVKAKTDTLPASIATSANVAAVGSAVAAKPTITEIQSVVNAAKSEIMGPANKNLTNVYGSVDLSTVAKTSDPRFANLDAPVSSRSTLTAAQVWSNSTRQLTQTAPLSNTDIMAIWNITLPSFITSGSIGKLLKDNLDATVSSRAQSSSVAALLSGVAQESSVQASVGTVLNKVTENQGLINTVTSKVNSVLAKVNNLPTDPASQSAILGPVGAMNLTLANVDSKANSIKAKTDTLPADIAVNSTVTAATAPLLRDDDYRLNALANLDAPVSSVQPADISGLATATQVDLATALISNKVQTNYNAIAAVQTSANLIKSSTDKIPAQPASVSDVAQAAEGISDKIDTIPTGLTSAQVWSYVNRSLTQDPATFGPDISLLAEKTDLDVLARKNYTNRMSTVFNSANGKQEVIAWAERDGQKVSGTNCSVSVRNSLGEEKWVSLLASSNSDGIFRFENTLSVPISQNYYIVISIVVDGSARTSVQSFFTVV